MSHDPGQTRPDAGRSPLPGSGLQTLEPRLLLSASPLDTQEPLEPASADQVEVIAQAAGDYTLGIDVSHWNGTINWTSVKNSGKEFVWAKATQGVTFNDSKWVTNATGAHNAGMYISGYHFATPYTGGVDDAAEEASFFYDAVSPYLTDGYLRPALDLEGTNSISVTQMSNWVHDFMNEFSSLSGGIVPIIYTGSSYANNELNSSVNIYDLWYPRWPSNPDFDNPPAAPGIWSSYDLWQYADDTSVSGISGDVDGDVFLGSLAEFQAKYVIDTTPDDHGDDITTGTDAAIPSTTPGYLSSVDTDWFRLTLTQGTDYTFSVLDNGLSNAGLRLYTASGSTLLASDDGPAVGSTLAQIDFSPTWSDTYYVEVVGNGGATGDYELVVQEADDHGDSIAEASGPLTSFAVGSLQTSTDVDYFHFTATAGMQYTVEIQSAGLTDAVLNLYNVVGSTLDQEVSAVGVSPLIHMEWTAPSDGEMYLKVWSNVGSTGDYFITMSESAPSIVGDLDSDGFVGIADLNAVLGAWNQSVTPGDTADPSGDGFVGIEDLNTVLGNWNAGTPPVETVSSAGQDEAVAEASGTQILGIDVSVWQGSISWSSVAASGKEFAFIRAVDRDGVTDTRFFNNIVNSKAAGIYAGAYQFVTPWTDGYNDAVEEATLFANVIAPYLTDGYLRPVIDIEAGPPHSPTPMELDNTVLTNWIHDYMTTFVALTGIEPLIYTNTNHALYAYDVGVNVYDLWLANWTNDPNNPPASSADGVWNGYDFWQYSSTTSVPGIAGNVDGDVYFGSVAEMLTDYGIVMLPDDHGNTRPEATSVGMPSVTMGELDTIMDEDWFELTLATGQAYEFALLGATLAGAELGLYTPGGTLLASNSGPASGGVIASLDYTPGYSDTFYLKVSYSDSLGTYGLTVQKADDHGDSIGEASGPLTTFILGGIQSNGDSDFFYFNATAGMQYDLKVLDAGLPDANLTLYDNGGAVVMQDSGSNPGGGARPATLDGTDLGRDVPVRGGEPGLDRGLLHHAIGVGPGVGGRSGRRRFRGDHGPERGAGQLEPIGHARRYGRPIG